MELELASQQPYEPVVLWEYVRMRKTVFNEKLALFRILTYLVHNTFHILIRTKKQKKQTPGQPVQARSIVSC